MESVKVLSLDFRGLSSIVQKVKAVQYDDGRVVRALLSGTEGNIKKVRIYCQKPSGMETYTDGTVVNDYCVLFSLTQQMLAETGVVTAQLQLMDGEHVVTSFDFKIQVSKNRIALSSITSSNEYQALIEALKKADGIDDKLKQKATYYNNVEEMKADSSLKAGSVAVTLGYYEANDFGGSTYIIRVKTEHDVDDGARIHELSSGNVAELIYEDYVSPEMFGAKGDSTTDDFAAFEKMISERKPIFLSKKYHLSKSITFYSDLFSSTNGELIFDTAVALEGNGIHVTGVVFNGNNLSPYIQLRGDDIVIHKCKFKDFSGNEAYKRTEGLYIGEDGEVLHTGIVVDSCLFDGATCKYENGVVGDNQGSLRQIYVRNSSVKIVNCEFKNLSGMEDGDIIHLQSRSISNTNYPYNKQGNLSFPSVPCIVQGNIFHMEKAKSAVKVQCSDVIVENNIVVVRDVVDTENKPRYVFRTQCTADVNISNNIVILEKTDALKLTYVFGAESTENAKITDNMIYDYSTGIDATYDELRSSHIIHAMHSRNLMFCRNNMLLTAIHNLMDIEYCSMTFSKNRIECLGEYPNTIFYMNKEYTHSTSTSDISESVVMDFSKNELIFSGTRSKIRVESMYIGSIRFEYNNIYGNVNSFEFCFEAYCPISSCLIKDIPNIPLNLTTVTGKDFSKIKSFIIENCKLVYADIQKSDLLQIKDCDITSTYQAVLLTDVLKVEADGNYIHDINNRVFRIVSGNPTITLENNEFDDNNFKVAIESHYNNDSFLRSNVLWRKNNRGAIKEVNTGTEPDSTMSYELGFMFFKESENKIVISDGKGNWI